MVEGLSDPFFVRGLVDKIPGVSFRKTTVH